METRVCKICGIEKELAAFQAQTNAKGITYHSRTCKKCSRDKLNETQRKWRSENKEHIQEYNDANRDRINGHHQKFSENNREKLRQKNREYYAKNKEEIKERQKDRKKVWDHNYYIKNKSDIRKKQIIRNKKRYHDSPNFKIRRTISRSISRALKRAGHSKGGKSCLQFLPYTIQELREHLEKQFEPWMTWENYGRYDPKTWDDNDPTTWKWSMDHIEVHSDFKYTSMEDEDFKKAWAISNLRPFSAKQNWLDGINRSRHKKAM